MNIIKLEDLNILPLEEVRRKVDKKDSKMTIEDEINEIGEELDLGEIETNLVNNVVLKHEEFGEPSKRNTYFLRPRYISAGRTNNFPSDLPEGKPRRLKKLAVPQLAKQDMS